MLIHPSTLIDGSQAVWECVLSNLSFDAENTTLVCIYSNCAVYLNLLLKLAGLIQVFFEEAVILGQKFLILDTILLRDTGDMPRYEATSY